MDRITSFNSSSVRYGSLRIIGSFFTPIGAVLLAIGTVLLAFGLYALLAGTTGEPPPGDAPFAARQIGVMSLGAGPRGILALFWSFALLVSGMQLVALGTVFRLLIDMEENTRASAQALDIIRMRLESTEGRVEPIFRS